MARQGSDPHPLGGENRPHLFTEVRDFAYLYGCLDEVATNKLGNSRFGKKPGRVVNLQEVAEEARCTPMPNPLRRTPVLLLPLQQVPSKQVLASKQLASRSSASQQSLRATLSQQAS